MHAEILVEDQSTAETVDVLLRRLRVEALGHTWNTRFFGSKPNMLGKLRATLAAIRRGSFADMVIVVIDSDMDDCRALKARIHADAVAAILIYPGQPTSDSALRIRLAMTELESWFIGDMVAVRSAYPRITRRDMRLRAGESADSLPHAWEWLERQLIRRGYFVTRMPKVEVARTIAAHLSLDPNHNTSRSFRLFLRTLREVYGLPTDGSSSRSPST